MSVPEKYAHLDFKPPKDVVKAAQRGLDFRSKYHRGGTEVALARGRQLSNRDIVSPDTIKRMYSYFARHEVDKKGKNFGNDDKPSNGYIAWLLWGGEPGKKWATRLREQIKKADKKS